MRLIDILLRPDSRPTYSVWAPNAQEPSDELDRALFAADKQIADLDQHPKGTVTTEALARATIRMADALRRAAEEQRRDTLSAARWQLANLVIAALALAVSIVAVWVEYAKP